MARTKDRYGRLLGNLWMGEAYLGEVLVAENWLSPFQSSRESLSSMSVIDRMERRMSRIGVWSLDQLPQAVKTLSSGGFQHRLMW